MSDSPDQDKDEEVTCASLAGIDGMEAVWCRSAGGCSELHAQFRTALAWSLLDPADTYVEEVFETRNPAEWEWPGHNPNSEQYNAAEVQMTQAFTMFEGHRDLEEAKSKWVELLREREECMIMGSFLLRRAALVRE
ncbi:unnamed protein product [Sympodiomycopsis kandeliae]